MDVLFDTQFPKQIIATTFLSAILPENIWCICRKQKVSCRRVLALDCSSGRFTLLTTTSFPPASISISELILVRSKWPDDDKTTVCHHLYQNPGKKKKKVCILNRSPLTSDGAGTLQQNLSHRWWLEVMDSMSIFQDSSNVLDKSRCFPVWGLICKTSFLVN